MVNKNNNEKQGIIVAIVTLIIILLLLTFGIISQTAIGGSNQIFNNGGGFFFEIDNPPPIINPEEIQGIMLPYTLTIFLGTGWDNAYYSELIAWYIQEDSLLGNNEIMASGKTEFSRGKIVVDNKVVGASIVTHNANKKNVPKEFNGIVDQTITTFPEGQYKIVFINIMTRFDDRINIPTTTVPFYRATVEADSKFDFNKEPIEWLKVMALDTTNIKTDFLKEIKFVIQIPKSQPPGQEEPPIVDEPSQINIGGGMIAIGLVIVLILIGTVAFVINKSKRK